MFLPDLSPLTNKIEQFTVQQQASHYRPFKSPQPPIKPNWTIIKKKMPRIEEKESKFTRRPTTLGREQLEYTLQNTLTYGVIAFAVAGVLASITYMTILTIEKVKLWETK